MGTVNPKSKNNSKNIYIGIALLAVVLIAFFTFKEKPGAENTQTSGASGEVKIVKSEVTSQAKFYPVSVDGVKMEVFAVKASDGTIRTAFNTCQVCYASGRGYYTQTGSDLVCKNCGNRFKIDQIEKVKSGCNPVPIDKTNKTDDGTNITISKDFLAKYKDMFEKWKS